MFDKKSDNEILTVLPDSELDSVTGGWGTFVVYNANNNFANSNSNNVVTNSFAFNIGNSYSYPG